MTQPLTTGAKAGIGSGVAVGVLILCLLIYIAILLRRRQSKEANTWNTNDDPHMPELGPGLLPEMPVVEKAGELSTERHKKIGKDEKGGSDVKAVSELQG